MISASELRKTFKGKTVLVTGHTGFKGSWLAYLLHILGANVVGYSIDVPADKKHSYYTLGIENKLVNSNNSFFDVCNYQSIDSIMQDYNPEFVFHLAAQAIVSTSYKTPLQTMKSNIMGTVNVLECLRCYPNEVTSVIITSDKCYKNKERYNSYEEHEEMGGDDPYSASKGACELVFHSFLVSYFQKDPNKRIASARAGNVLGGGDWSANRLIPDCIRDILYKDGVVEIRSPNSIRPWTFVVDILYGYIVLAHFLVKDKDHFQGSWNFASGETATVSGVCASLIDSLGKGSIKINTNFSIGKECGLLLIDGSKARRELGWKPIYTVNDAIGVTARWYLEQQQQADMEKYSMKFIEKYFEMTEKL